MNLYNLIANHANKVIETFQVETAHFNTLVQEGKVPEVSHMRKLATASARAKSAQNLKELLETSTAQNLDALIFDIRNSVRHIEALDEEAAIGAYRFYNAVIEAIAAYRNSTNSVVISFAK